MLHHQACQCPTRLHALQARLGAKNTLALIQVVNRAGAAIGTLVLIVALGVACAVSLSGCGASLDEPFDGSLTPNGQKTAASTSNAENNEGSEAANSAQDGATSKAAAAAENLASVATTSKTAATPASMTQAALARTDNTSKAKATTENFPDVAETFAAAATPGNSGYRIGPLDILEVSVFKVPDLSRSVQVSDVGTINLPLVGEVPVSGMTARELEHDLTAKLGNKYLQSPQVTVYVKEFNSQRVTIEGAIKKPGVYPVQGKTSLLQVLALAQGLNDDAEDTVVVFRNVNGKRIAGKFDIDNIRDGSAPDPKIQQGDVVVVSTSAMKGAWQTFLKGLGAAGTAAVFF